MKNAFIDTNGVLTSWGYAESNNDDVLIEVPDDFDKEPGKWKYEKKIWVSYVAPPTLESVLAQRVSLAAAAMVRRGPLQDAVDLEVATAAEKALLLKLKRYSVDLSRIEQQAGFPTVVDWPAVPE